MTVSIRNAIWNLGCLMGGWVEWIGMKMAVIIKVARHALTCFLSWVGVDLEVSPIGDSRRATME